MNSVSINTYLVNFFEKHETSILETWWQNILDDTTELQKEKIKENGSLMYQLIKKSLTDSLIDDELKNLAHKVAKECVESNINIGDFVHNVNYGRTLIINHIFLARIEVEELPKIIEKINLKFDQFIYYAVKRYTFLKEKEIEEKNYFITQSHKDKLTLLGQMSSSFVHEFRNPLTSVIGFVKLLKTDYPNLKYIDIIDHELDQLKFRITQFLHTSKNDGAQEQRKEVLTVHHVLEEIIEFLYPSIVDTDVNVKSNFEADIAINANKNEIKQVILNILMNSIDAVTKKGKPREIIVCSFIEGDDVIINIANNGPRIPEETIKIIFEPFYTTKELGTGIGLFVCKKIIDQHRGTISCYSNEFLTTFSIRLPLAENINKQRF